MVPAAFPYLLTGFKIGWSRAWRAIIAAEMVIEGKTIIGVSSALNVKAELSGMDDFFAKVSV